MEIWSTWKVIGIAYVIALIPSLLVTMVYRRNNMMPQLSSWMLFISIWLVMPIYLFQKIFSFIYNKFK